MSSPLVQFRRDPDAAGHARLPRHCVAPSPRAEVVAPVARLLRDKGLRSVCEEARCPNRGECWAQGHVTFMLLGRVCTRACRFCAVETGRPANPPDPDEPENVARAARTLDLTHIVLTSVNRDDLPDGGASQFADSVRAIRAARPETSVEVLTPDFQGNPDAVATVCDARPDVYNHNVETVPRLYRHVRPGAGFLRSLRVLGLARDGLAKGLVKSGFMVGLGETRGEVMDLLDSLRSTGVESVTIGQYLRPTRKHLPVERYWDPTEFDEVADAARDLGFLHVASGPRVRSSYNAGAALDEVRRARRERGGVPS